MRRGSCIGWLPHGSSRGRRGCGREGERQERGASEGGGKRTGDVERGREKGRRRQNVGMGMKKGSEGRGGREKEGGKTGRGGGGVVVVWW